MYTIVTVRIINGWSKSRKDYYFKSYDRLFIGDIVVCDTVNGPVLGEVIGINMPVPDGIKVNAEIIARVDMSRYKERKIKREKRIEIEKKLEARFNELDKLAKYRLFAKEDPELACLLDEYDKL